MAASFITFQRLIQNSRKPSQLFHKATKMAISAAMAAITKVTGFAARMPHKALSPPPILEMPPISVGMKVMMLPTAETTFPITISTGPIAAARSPYGNNGVLGALIHAVQLVNKALHPCDDLADGGHEDFTKRNGKLLQLAFQNGKLSGEVILHGRRHLRRLPSQFAMALLTFSMSRRGGVHQRKGSRTWHSSPQAPLPPLPFRIPTGRRKAVLQSARIALKSLMLPSALVVAIVTLTDARTADLHFPEGCS